MKLSIGVQIWALRNLINDNAETVFKKLSQAGYGFIEPAGFDIKAKTIQGFTPFELKKIAAKHHLKIHSGHFAFDLKDTDLICECAAEAGMQYIVCPFLKDVLKASLNTYKKAADELNEIGEIAKTYQLKLAYHNHAHEFDAINDINPFDILLENTDPEYVNFQMDLGWMIYANQSPINYFNKHPGRFPLWHLRDIDKATKQTVAIGNGIVDFKSIYLEKEKAGLQLSIVEMASDTENPLEKMIKSIENIDSLIVNQE